MVQASVGSNKKKGISYFSSKQAALKEKDCN
jgi:hypothetical protein